MSVDFQTYLSQYADQTWGNLATQYRLSQNQYYDGLPKVKDLFTILNKSFNFTSEDQVLNLYNNVALYVISGVYSTQRLSMPAELNSAFTYITGLIETLQQQQPVQNNSYPNQSGYQNGYRGGYQPPSPGYYGNTQQNVSPGYGMGGVIPNQYGGSVQAGHDRLPALSQNNSVNQYNNGANPQMQRENFTPPQAQALSTTTVNQTAPAQNIDVTPITFENTPKFNFIYSPTSEKDVEIKLNGSEGIDNVLDILNTFTGGNDTSIVYLITTYDSIILYPSDPARIDELVRKLSELGSYTSLYQWLLEVNKFNDDAIINFVNNRLNQLINLELENRTGQTFPFTQIYGKWDKFMETIKQMNIEWILDILLEEVISYSKYLKILGTDTGDTIAISITRPVPTVVFGGYLSYLHKKKQLVTGGFTEDSFYILYHAIFSRLYNVYNLSRIKMVDRSMLKFELSELREHLSTPARNYTVKTLESIW